MPFDLLWDKDGLNLRDYQLRAIQAAEQAIMDGKNTALIAMATGTGKTRIVLGMIYRTVATWIRGSLSISLSSNPLML